MSVKLYVQLPLEMPKEMENSMDRLFPADEFLQRVPLTGKRIMNMLPGQIPWIIRGGYADLHFVLEVAPKPSETKEENENYAA